METKTIYREFFPGYMGHIPLKNEVIGMTVGATNEYIKSYLTREPEYEQNVIPSQQKDYRFYNKRYFTENMAKEYRLEEDKVFSNRSKEARTWINGSKFKIYPQHIPGYQGHIPGIYGANILGIGYAKSTAVAIKGDYCNKRDLPPDERYKAITKMNYEKPKMRSDPEEDVLKKTAELRNKSEDPSKRNEINSTSNLNIQKETTLNKESGFNNELSQTFKEILNYDDKPISELPYIVGYKGFRRGVKAGNHYGKNFREVSCTSINNAKAKQRSLD